MIRFGGCSDPIDKMIREKELRWAKQQAYLPEHLIDYTVAVSGAEPYLHHGYACLLDRRRLIFIGYPLGRTSRKGGQDIKRIFSGVCARFQPSTISVMAPHIWLPDEAYERFSQDVYYKLDLPIGDVAPKLEYMPRRAREVQVGEGRFGREYRKLVERFIAGRQFTSGQKQIYRQMGRYLQKSRTARLLEARWLNRLAAFIIVDLASIDYAFYMFSIRSTKIAVPGVADLLFKQMVETAQKADKKAINLGLGINAGIRYFKEKWGGRPFMPYISAVVRKKDFNVSRLIHKL